VPSYETPIVHTHPRTGRPLLFITEGMTRGVVGMDPEESEDLLEPIFEHLYAPENRLEHEWEAGDLVVWDNLTIQHGRPNVTTAGPARTLRKIGLPMPQEAIAGSLVASYEEVESAP
jgi:alpha-ketoglutarate-dependent taurine dioxygenase